MYLKDKKNGDLVEVLDISDLANPCKTEIEARPHAGEELQEPCSFSKADLVFPSDEALPRCWTDPHYHD